VDIRFGEIHRKGSTAVLQVGAGAKRLVAHTRQHDDADVLVVMGFAVTLGDPGDHIGVDGVALVRTVDGDPERLSALFAYHAIRVSHCSTHPLAKCWPAFAAG